jgi:protein-L-isoaspartate(D-aspartate) O-methyltransferase
MLVNAGVTHATQLWLARLKEGGRLLLPLTCEFPNSNLGKGWLLMIRREQNTFVAAFRQGPIVIFSCRGVRDATLNRELSKAYSTRMDALRQIQCLRLDPHEANSTCWVHTELMCLSAKAASSSSPALR